MSWSKTKSTVNVCKSKIISKGATPGVDVGKSYLNIITNGFVFKASFYGQAVFAKILPCFLLVTFIYLLIHSLLIVKQNKKDLNFDKKKVNFN